jgi:hypothetical protein
MPQDIKPSPVPHPARSIGPYPGFREKLAEGRRRARTERQSAQLLLERAPTPKAAQEALQAALRYELMSGTNCGLLAKALVRDAIRGQGAARVAARDAILKRFAPAATEADGSGRKLLEGIRLELSDGRLQSITLATSAGLPSRIEESGTPEGGMSEDPDTLSHDPDVTCDAPNTLSDAPNLTCEVRSGVPGSEGVPPVTGTSDSGGSPEPDSEPPEALEAGERAGPVQESPEYGEDLED